jgi:hypothetical protein
MKTLQTFCLDSSKNASGHVQFVDTPSGQEVFLYICIALRNTAVCAGGGGRGGDSQNSPNEASDFVVSLAKNIQHNSYKTMKS